MSSPALLVIDENIINLNLSPRFRVHNNSLQIRSEDGQRIWTHTFEVAEGENVTAVEVSHLLSELMSAGGTYVGEDLDRMLPAMRGYSI